MYTGAFVASMPLELGLTSQGRTDLSALSYLGWDSARAAAMTLPILLGAGLHWTVWAVALLMVVRLAVTWVVLLRTTRGPLWNGKLLRTQLAYALPFGAALAMSVPQHSFHQWVVSARFDPAIFAIYVVGCFQLPIVDLLYTPTSEVLMVHIGELDRKGRLQESIGAFRESVARLGYVFVPTAVFLVVAAPEFIEAVFGHRFADAVPLFRVSSLAVLFGCFPLDGLLRARGDHDHLPLLPGEARDHRPAGPGDGALARSHRRSALLARGRGPGEAAARLARPEGAAPELFRGDEGAGSPGVAGQSVGGGPRRCRGGARLEAPRQHDLGPNPHSFFWRLLPITAVSVLFGIVYLLGLQLMGVSLLRLVRSLRRPVAAASEMERPPLDVEPSLGSAVRVPSAADAS